MILRLYRKTPENSLHNKLLCDSSSIQGEIWADVYRGDNNSLVSDLSLAVSYIYRKKGGQSRIQEDLKTPVFLYERSEYLSLS